MKWTEVEEKVALDLRKRPESRPVDLIKVPLLLEPKPSYSVNLIKVSFRKAAETIGVNLVKVPFLLSERVPANEEGRKDAILKLGTENNFAKTLP